MQVYWPIRAGGTVERDSEPVQEITELLHGASSSSMFALKSRSDLATGTGGREEAGGGRTGGAGAEGGADGPVDGDSERTRMGEERQMPYGVIGRFESVEREGSSESVL